mgnify:FL=1
MKKTGSLSVKVGEYEKDGNMKGRYKTIGRIMADDKGKEFVLLDATVISMQLFALANQKRQDSIIISIFRDEKNGGDTSDGGEPF